MKNIFRKAVQKVRNTTVKVFNTIQENPELAVLAAGAIISGVAVGVTIRQAKKEAAWMNNGVAVEDLPSYNVTTVLNAVQHAHDAFEAARKADPDAESANLAKYGMTREDAWYLEQIGLASGSDTNHCRTRLFYVAPEQTESTDA